MATYLITEYLVSSGDQSGFSSSLGASRAYIAFLNPVIRYVATDIQNAQGPHVHDPRTGEILESDIIWYHNVMRLLRNWFFIQTAAINPEARGVNFKEEVMGRLIQFVAAHEVGHTLGLPHNMGSSCLLYTSPSPRDQRGSRMPSSA